MSRTMMLALMVAAVSTMTWPVSAMADSGWIAEFVWSPQYCSKYRDSREKQCQQTNGFVLHDLVRVVDGRTADNCDHGEALSQRILDQMAQFTKNRIQTQMFWHRHGRCSGLSETDYASFAEHVDRRMSWPIGYQPGSPEQLSTPADVVAALKDDNPGLKEEALALRCKRRELEAVSLCLDDRFELSASACLLSSNCGESVRLRSSR
ncbi:hypothetical protein [Nevskia sp.]|uniref:hypothetical protein n=1 Tax=Nevskia sp. TaxID=1929292 RepID=UPI0025FE852D|nr:hypothetical protein [Nevskia sp.]